MAKLHFFHSIVFSPSLTREQAVFHGCRGSKPFQGSALKLQSSQVSVDGVLCFASFSPFLHGVTVLASGRLLILSCSTFLHEPDAGAWKNSAYKNVFYLLPVQLDVRPQVDRFVFPDVHRTVFTQEHAVYIGIKVGRLATGLMREW